MVRKYFVKILLLTAFIAMLFDGCEPVKKSDKLDILIPLYSYPNWYGSNYKWKKLIDMKKRYNNSNVVAIINPNNGIFDSKNSDYERGIKDLINAKIKVVGYVYTKYATRDINDIKRNIDAWVDIYKKDGVSGIFFDETSTKKEDLNFYKEISRYARQKGLDFIVLNPGVTTDQSYIDSNIADVIVSYENDYYSFINNPPLRFNRPSKNTKLSMLIYKMDKNGVEELVKKAKENNFSYIYLTEDGYDGNPWDNSPQYLIY